MVMAMTLGRYQRATDGAILHHTDDSDCFGGSPTVLNERLLARREVFYINNNISSMPFLAQDYMIMLKSIFDFAMDEMFYGLTIKCRDSTGQMINKASELQITITS